MHQLDVNSAFLLGELNEEVYMNPQEGYDIPPRKALKLNKSLYGLRQASRQWYAKLSFLSITYRFKSTLSNPSLFINHPQNSLVALLIYVNDVIVVSNNMDEVTAINSYLHNLFKIKDLCELKYFM